MVIFGNNNNFPMKMMCQSCILMFVFVNIVVLYGHNVLVYGICPRGCVCDDHNLHVSCSSSAILDYVPNTLIPALRVLHLSENHIRSIKSSLAVYRNLQMLNISNNEISVLEDHNFIYNSQLQTLVLNNNIISKMQNNTFKGLTSLTKLLMRYNLMEEIESNIFKVLNNLEILDLSHNRISHISSDAFNGLERLKSLYLRANQLNRIPSHAFHSVPNINLLDIGLNSFITNVSVNAFSQLNSLEEMSLDGCALHVIEPSAFKGLSLLSILQLQGNNFEEIPSEAFYDVNRLEVLRIGQNLFTVVPSNAFLHLEQLKSLEISDGQYLSRIEDGAFEGLQNLEILEMANNTQLMTIDRHLFHGLPQLRYLNIRGNSLVTLELEFSNDISKSVLLDVRDNPLTCNCSIQWLRNYLIFGANLSQYYHNDGNGSIENNSFSYLDLYMTASKVICEHPPALKGKLIMRMHPEEFGCFQLDTKVPIIIAIMIGVLLVCGVIIIFVIRCKYRLAGIVKNQWFVENANGANPKRNDLNYRKPDFSVIPNIDYNIEENNRLTAAACEDAVRYPLKLTPITEL